MARSGEEKRSTLLDGITLRASQTWILVYKDLLYLKKHLFSAIVRLLIPCLILIGLYLLNLQTRNNIIKTSTGGNLERYPTPNPIKRLPKFDDHSQGHTIFYEPCGNELAYEIVKTLAKNNDPPLTIGDIDDHCTTINQGYICNYDICPVNGTIHEVIAAIHKNGKHIRVHGGYSFTFETQFGKEAISYDLFYNATQFYRTPFLAIDPQNPYDMSLELQRAVDEAILEVYAKKYGTVDPSKRMTIDIGKKAFPYVPELHTGVPRDIIISTMGTFFFFAALYLVAIYTHYTINNERDLQLREGMRSMGLKDFSYWTALYITQSIYMFITCILLIIIGYICQMDFFWLSNPIPIFLIFFLMGQALIAMFMFSSTICGSLTWTNINAFVVFVFSCIFLLLFMQITPVTAPAGIEVYNYPGWYFLHIFPTMNFGKCITDVIQRTTEKLNGTEFVAGPGYSFSDMFSTKLYENQVETVWPTAANLAILILNAAFFILLTWYFDKVVPDKYGRRLPWYFPFTGSYWGFVNRSRDNLAVDVALHKADRFHSILPDTDKDIYKEYQSVISSLENDPNNELFPVKVVKLSKTYTKFFSFSHTSAKNALDNLTISAEKGKVTVLLGHNGAGKTTAMNMLTGMITPTAGDALIYGNSLINDMENITKISGVCFQHDIIWPELTGYQHMRLFATLKGIPRSKIAKEIKEKLEEVMLWKYRNQTASTYSGGMKRRLSVAMSILGDPKIIFMDEPTSGMDPSIRRKIWNLITKLKKDKVIILTTHSMAEAEAIGDKIAILALGRLRAIGTTLHLKNRFGAGYSLDVVTGDTNALKNKILEISPHSKVQTEISGTITFSLPRSIVYQKEVYNLLKYIEQESSKDKSQKTIVKDWMVSHTTLEEVFLRITHGKADGEIENDTKQISGQQQLNIVIEGQDEPCGFVIIDSETSLADARNLMRSIPEIPKEYKFVSNGIPVSIAQEQHLFASNYLPLIVIQPYGDKSQDSKRQQLTITNVHKNTEVDVGHTDKVIVLEKKLAAAMHEMEEMKLLIEKLQKENKELKQQLAKGQNQKSLDSEIKIE